MNTIAEPRESQGTAPAKRPIGHLQAKIDDRLLGRLKTLAGRTRKHPRDIVEEALECYLPKAEEEAGLAAVAQE